MATSEAGAVYTPPNWIEGPNPFRLTTPSPWWLRLLHDYDAQLLVFPSQKDAAYRLARRVRAEARMGLNALILHTHPDTIFMIREGAIAVATLPPWAVQSDKIIRDLSRRDMWRFGGADKVLASAEEGERLAAAARDAADLRDLDYVNAEAYQSLKVRKGERLFTGDVHRGRRGRPGAGRPVTLGVRPPGPYTQAVDEALAAAAAPAGHRDHKTVSSPLLDSGKRQGPDARITLTDPL